jgi:hypothetical protein
MRCIGRPHSGVRAVRVFGLVAVLHALQVLGQRLAARLARWRLRGLGRLGQAALQFGQLRLQAGFVLGQRVLEQGTLLGRHGLGLGAELPALQAREFEVDLLQLGVAPGDLAGLGLHLLLQPRDQRARIGRQTGGSCAMSMWGAACRRACSACCTRQLKLRIGRCDVNGASVQRELAQVRVMMLRSPRRCHGRPTVRASNCATVSCNAQP